MTQFVYNNYIDLAITSSKTPSNTRLLIETNSSGTFYTIHSAAPSELFKSTDKMATWAQPNGSFSLGGELTAFFHDRANSKLYFCTENTDSVAYIDLTDDSITAIGGDPSDGFWDISEDLVDVFLVNGDIWCTTYANKTTPLVSGNNWYKWVDPNWVSQLRVALPAAYTQVISPNLIIGSEIYIVRWIPETGFSGIINIHAAGGGSTLDTIGDASPTSNPSQYSLSYDGVDVLYYVALWDDPPGDDLPYLYSMSLTDETVERLGKYDVALMQDRDTGSGIQEKAFHISEDKVYQLPSSYKGNLNYISNFNFADTIHAISDNFLMCIGGEVYEFTDMMDSIIEGLIYHSRNYFPYLEMKFNSDNITITEGLIIQIIGPYTANGSTTADQVVFEGLAKKPTKGRIQYVFIENQGSEMEYISPRGNKSGRTDQIITDINDDGAPNGPTYITDGTLATGSSMGLLDLSGAKIYRTVLNDFAEHDAFLWSLTPQGALDYNAGGIDSGADLRNDITTYNDTILQVQAWTIAKLNQIIVNGSINSITGEPYIGQWDDEEDQQENGINSNTIEDAQLNSATLCQAKADTMGGNESVRTRARFKFRKTTYGLIQPGQTITFLYDITNYMTISSAQYILDKIIMNIKTEVGYAEISSGL